MTMRVLIASASRHGATHEIAESIGRALEDRGLETQVAHVEDIEDAKGFDALVLGSAVYAGRWLEPARRFAERHRDELTRHPTWLFSSGPIGDPPRPEDDEAVHLDEAVEALSAREHRVFAGRLDRHRLGLGERALVIAFRAPDGDFRDWEAIGVWASSIADELQV
jgi:menaquinone-dependent protoporphyrinogen oxidase